MAIDGSVLAVDGSVRIPWRSSLVRSRPETTGGAGPAAWSDVGGSVSSAKTFGSVATKGVAVFGAMTSRAVVRNVRTA